MSGIPEEILSASVSINGREPLVIRIECDDYDTRDHLFEWLSSGPDNDPVLNNPIQVLTRTVDRMIARLTKLFKRGGGKVTIFVRNSNIEDEGGNFLMTNDDKEKIIPSLRRFLEANGVQSE